MATRAAIGEEVFCEGVSDRLSGPHRRMLDRNVVERMTTSKLKDPLHRNQMLHSADASH